jgi:hypothetical protein
LCSRRLTCRGRLIVRMHRPAQPPMCFSILNFHTADLLFAQKVLSCECVCMRLQVGLELRISMWLCCLGCVCMRVGVYMYVRAYVFLRADEDAMVSASDCGCEEILGIVSRCVLG